MKAISQFFNMLFTLFQAGERLAKAADNLCQVAEEQSAAYVEEIQAEREQARAQLKLVSTSTSEDKAA